MENPLQEHAEAAERAHEGNKRAALLVAALAAVLALSEQGAKHAEMRVEDSSIAATDTWGQFQAKSTRSSMAHDLADLVAALPAGSDAEATARLKALHARLQSDQTRYDHGPDGRDGTADKARALENERDHAVKRAASFDNAAAMLELAIVLATASVIVGVKRLLWGAMVLGVLGIGFCALAFLAPPLGAL